jgi:hypothetical protein
MPYHSTCGLSPAQTCELIDRVDQVHAARPDQQRYDFEMPVDQAVVMVLVMVRHNLAQQVTADLHGVSQSTVSRIFRYLVPILGMVTMMDLGYENAGSGTSPPAVETVTGGIVGGDGIQEARLRR